MLIADSIPCGFWDLMALEEVYELVIQSIDIDGNRCLGSTKMELLSFKIIMPRRKLMIPSHSSQEHREIGVHFKNSFRGANQNPLQPMACGELRGRSNPIPLPTQIPLQ